MGMAGEGLEREGIREEDEEASKEIMASREGKVGKSEIVVKKDGCALFFFTAPAPPSQQRA